MPLDPQTKVYLDQMAALNMPPLSALPLQVVRQGVAAQVASAPASEPVAMVVNRTIPGPAGEIPVRIYTPEGSGPFPALVFFHGGGWVICDLDTHDSLCRSLCNGAGCVVVSVDYRLAPEHKFPAAPEDCYAATQWVAGHAAEINANPGKIAIGGDSAGGNLTAVVAQMVRDQGGPQSGLAIADLPGDGFHLRWSIHPRKWSGYFLTIDDMNWFMNHYLNSEADRLNPLASPLLAADLSNLPPALILTAEYDPLRDEGEQYGQRLQAADVPVIVRRYHGLIHGFFGMALIVDEAKRAVEETSQTLREAFARG